MAQELISVGDLDPIKVQTLATALKTAGVDQIGENGIFHLSLDGLTAVVKVAHDAGFSVEVLGAGRTDGELQLRVSQNVDAAPVDRKTLIAGQVSSVLGPRQDVGH